MLNALLSVPAISRFMFSRWRTITISGIAVATASNGHKSAKSQPGVSTITSIKARGKAIDAAIEASETYRHIKTVTAHTPRAKKEQTV